MNLRLKVFLLAVVPLLLAIVAIASVVRIEARALADAETTAVLPVLDAARRAELRHYVDLALGAVARLPATSDPEQGRREALEVLRGLDFGADGYFFVYDQNGRNLMHPRQPELVGQSLWEMRDARGQPVIQQLIARARSGGGYIEFDWNRPSTGRVERKLGYVTIEPRWGLMLGTGLYLDDIESARVRIDQAASAAISATMSIIAVIAGAAVLIVAVTGFALNLSTQRSAEQRLRALAHQVVLSQETERTRVARELHDGVSQLLVSVKFVFETLLERLRGQGDEPLVEMADKGVSRLNEVLREIRRISHDLRPTALDDLGLDAALSQMLTEFGQRTGVKTRFKYSGSAAVVPTPVATALFRVVQEALTNIERHAAASEVALVLICRSQGLRLSINDDGNGFDAQLLAATSRAGLGLTSMRERVETFGGLFAVRSSATGTSIDISLPGAALRPLPATEGDTHGSSDQADARG